MPKKTRTRYVPLLWGAMAMVVAALLLPSALRPPPDEASASAQFSPDAPPDEDPDVIIQSLQQANSRTAGGVQIVDPSEPDAPPITEPPPPPPPAEVLTKGHCVGSPARQIESVYATECVPVFRGDNGGATSKGVTADEIRLVIFDSTDGGGDQGYEGRVTDQPMDDETDQGKTDRLYQKYFNDRYEFYGRKLQLIVETEPSTNPEDAEENRAHVVGVDDKYDGIFAGISEVHAVLDELGNRGIVGFGGWSLQAELYSRHGPHLFGLAPDGDKLSRLNAEYICKKLVGRNAVHAGDPSYRSVPRKFGMIYNAIYGATNIESIVPLVQQRCGVEMFAADIGFGGLNGNLQSTIAQFKVEGVTTVIVGTDPVTPAAITSTADSSGYFPEWFITGVFDLDAQVVPSLFGYSRGQWANAFGMGVREWSSRESADWYRAYKEMNPQGTPSSHSWADQLFPKLVQIANGIQRAGPNLTPESFQKGLMSYQRPRDPTWAICCGYSPEDRTYSDRVSEVYWVNDATPPECSSVEGYQCVGAYIYARCGERFGEGEIPNEPPQVFEGGCIDHDKPYTPAGS